MTPLPKNRINYIPLNSAEGRRRQKWRDARDFLLFTLFCFALMAGAYWVTYESIKF